MAFLAAGLPSTPVSCLVSWIELSGLGEGWRARHPGRPPSNKSLLAFSFCQMSSRAPSVGLLTGVVGNLSPFSLWLKFIKASKFKLSSPTSQKNRRKEGRGQEGLPSLFRITPLSKSDGTTAKRQIAEDRQRGQCQGDKVRGVLGTRIKAAASGEWTGKDTGHTEPCSVLMSPTLT